jgi:acyl-CoA thioester hydrolase
MSMLPAEPRTLKDALAFARAWADAWGRRDLPALLAAYADDVELTSPRAVEVVGCATVIGKPALAAYWEKALGRLRSIRFDVEDVTFDATARRVAIAYRAHIDGADRHTAEHLTFGEGGKIDRASVYHGASALPPPPPLTVELARARQLTHIAEVEPRFIDLNGHMNVAWYVHLFDQATWAFFCGLGIDEAYMSSAGRTVFAAEENLRYLAELKLGDRITIHTQLNDVQPKSLKFVHVMIDVERDRIAATAELVGVHVDATERRARPFPDAMLARIRAALSG